MGNVDRPPRGGVAVTLDPGVVVINGRGWRPKVLTPWRPIYSLPLRPSIGRVAGLGSKATMTRLVAVEAVLGERPQPAARTAVPVRVSELGGRVVWLRPRSRDRAALEFLHQGHHLPPPGLTGPVRHAAVFGANIGLLVADLANRYPQARVLGVEADHDNAELARRNLAHLASRCTLKEAAVWHRNETLTLAWEPDAWGQAVTGPATRNGSGSGTVSKQMQAVSAGDLLAGFAGPAPVDYLLVNVELAWHEMLRHGQWAANVRSIRIEIQDHYQDAVPMLEALGFQAWLQPLDWGAFATGIRH